MGVCMKPGLRSYVYKRLYLVLLLFQKVYILFILIKGVSFSNREVCFPCMHTERNPAAKSDIAEMCGLQSIQKKITYSNPTETVTTFCSPSEKLIDTQCFSRN